MLRALSRETDVFLRQHSVPYAVALSAGGSARYALSLYAPVQQPKRVKNRREAAGGRHGSLKSPTLAGVPHVL